MLKKYRNELIILLSASTVVLVGSIYLGWKQLGSESTAQEASKPQKANLIQGSEEAEDNCLAPRGQFLEKVGKVDKYTLVAFTYDFDQPLPKTALPKGVKEAEKHRDMHNVPHNHKHAHSFKVPDPNLGFALVEFDPTVGCKPLMRSVRGEPMPESLNEENRILLQRLRWTYLRAHLKKEYKATLSSYLNERLTDTGPNQMGLSLESRKVLTEMGVKLPKWLDPNLSEREQLEAEYEAFGIENYHIPPEIK